MDGRDEWSDGILEGDLDGIAEEDCTARRNAERIARDARNMNAVLSAMAGQVSEGVPGIADGQVVPLRRRFEWRRPVVAVAAAAAIAAVTLVGGEEGDEDGDRFASAAPSMISGMDVEADGPFVVFPTSDPDIAVVWLLNLEESE